MTQLPAWPPRPSHLRLTEEPTINTMANVGSSRRNSLTPEGQFVLSLTEQARVNKLYHACEGLSWDGGGTAQCEMILPQDTPTGPLAEARWLDFMCSKRAEKGQRGFEELLTAMERDLVPPTLPSPRSASRRAALAMHNVSYRCQ